MKRWLQDGLLPYLLLGPALLAAVLLVPLVWAVLRLRIAMRGV